MSSYSTTLTARLLLPDAGDGVLVQATFSYDSTDPVTINVHFHTNLDEPVIWVFGRELLLSGVDQRAGEGDVAVWPARDGLDLHLSLSSPFGAAEFTFDMGDIVAFLDKTFELVPAGTEFDAVDLDAELSKLLEGDTL